MANRDDKFIEDLKANGYQVGDLSTLPSDISEADRRKVEQYEADQANEQAKNIQGQKPELQTFHVELNPNQYGFAERIESPTQQSKPVKDEKLKTDKTDALDHDNDGRKGGVKPSAETK